MEVSIIYCGNNEITYFTSFCLFIFYSFENLANIGYIKSAFCMADQKELKTLSRKNGEINSLTKDDLQKELAKLKLDTWFV